MTGKDAFEEYGISKTTFTRYMNKIFALLDVSNMKELKLKYQLKQITESTLRKTLKSINFDTKGTTPNLLPDEESLLVATAEMKCYASKPQQMKRFAGQTNMLLRKLVESGASHINPDIKSASKIQYVCRVLKRVIAREPDFNDEYDPKRLKRCGTMKAGGLSNARAKQADPRLSWYMFHGICDMHRTVKQKCEEHIKNALVLNGVQEEIAESILGPKVTRTIDLPDLSVAE